MLFASAPARMSLSEVRIVVATRDTLGVGSLLLTPEDMWVTILCGHMDAML